MTDQTTDPLAALMRAVDVQMLALYVNLGEELDRAIRKYIPPGEPITDQARRLIMAEYDKAAARLYGKARGDTTSALYDLVTMAAHGAQAQPYAASMARWRDALGVDLFGLMLAEVQAERGVQ